MKCWYCALPSGVARASVVYTEGYLWDPPDAKKAIVTLAPGQDPIDITSGI